MGTLDTALSILRGGAAPAATGIIERATVAAGPSTKGFTLVAGKPGGRTVTIDHNSRDYAASSVAYRCVEAIASNAANVDMGVLLRSGDFNIDHPAARLWNRSVTDGPMSARAARVTMISRYQLSGETMAYIDRGESGVGEPRGLWPIYDPVEVIVDGSRTGAAGQLQGFVVKLPGGKRQPLLPSEVLWLRNPDPFSAWGAVAPWKAALHAVESDAYARGFQRSTFENGAQISSVVYLGDLTDAQHERALAEFATRQQGGLNAGRPFVTSTAPPEPGAQRPNAPTVTPLTLSPVDVQLLDARTRNAEEVMLAFGVPRDYLLGGTTYENRSAAKATLWSDKIVPDLDMIAAEFDRQLVPDDADAAGFDLSPVDALQESTDAVWGRVRGIAYTDVNTLDELREMLGYPPMVGGIGALTLTAYRARVQAETAAEFTSEDAARDALGSKPLGVQGRMRPAGQVIRVRGTTVALPAPRPAASAAPVLIRSGPRKVTRPALKFYDAHEAIGRRTVQRLAEKQQRVVLRNLARLSEDRTRELVERARTGPGGTQLSPWTERHLVAPVADGVRIAADDIFDVRHWTEATAEQAQAWIAGVWERGAVTLSDTLGLDFTRFEPKVLNALEDRRNVLATVVTDTTRRVLEAEILAHGLEEGEGADELADRIRAVFTDLSGYRAERIARTETVGGYGGASRIIAMESGVVSARSWLATEDSRTRESHVAADGERVQGWATRYSTGCLHPGDPTGPAAETVNCRCVEEFEVDE